MSLTDIRSVISQVRIQHFFHSLRLLCSSHLGIGHFHLSNCIKLTLGRLRPAPDTPSVRCVNSKERGYANLLVWSQQIPVINLGNRSLSPFLSSISCRIRYLPSPPHPFLFLAEQYISPGYRRKPYPSDLLQDLVPQPHLCLAWPSSVAGTQSTDITLIAPIRSAEDHPPLHVGENSVMYT